MNKLLLIIAIAALFTISSASTKSESLAAHNKHRAALGLPPLTWSEDLARDAQNWSDYLARRRRASHSTDRDNNVGESIAFGNSDSNSINDFIDTWAEEKDDFIEGKNYPDCSATGDEDDVEHYTQMVWEKTTEIGCGSTTRSGRRYYVCQYKPAGNIDGQPVYTDEDSEETAVDQPEEPVVIGQPVVTEPVGEKYDDPFIQESLDEHNKYRDEVGVVPLTWSTSLAQSAQKWADNLASRLTMVHSTNRNGIGENLAWNTEGTVASLVKRWGDEKLDFLPGKPFKSSSRTGSWSDVAHYTQMVWKSTTQIGCGMGINGRRHYYVCHYSPQGNYNNQPAY